MKQHPKIFRLTFALMVAAHVADAVVLLDDTWVDGTRTDTSLPVESAWYASSASSLTAAEGVMTGTAATSSRSWWTYFTTNAANPVRLVEGDTLKLTLAFTPVGINANNSSYSFRLGVYDFSSGSRTTADGNSPNATGVTGYLLNMNFGQTFGVNNPIQIRERVNVSSSDLMGSSGDYTTLAAGGGSNGDPAFSNGVPCILTFSVTRLALALEITTTFTNTAGWSVSQTAADTSGFTNRFDTLALRPSKASETATNFLFTELKIELLSSGTVAPVITSQPQDRTVIAGQNVTLNVEADGSAPLAYQWFFNTNTPLPAATNALFTVFNAQSTNAGIYSVRVTNSAGSVTSDFAALTVNQPVAPVITTNPQSQVVSAGLNAAFSVTAAGTAPLSYQWYFNTNTPLAGATNAALALSNVQSQHAGGYSVVVTNVAGAATSEVALLTVDMTPAAPIFTLQPMSLGALVGGNASFSVQAGGANPIGYQWRKNGANLAGASQPTLLLTNVQSADAGAYVCVATNSVGGATSSVAALTVSAALPESAFNLMGFAHAATGGGVIPETDPKWRNVYTADDLVAALDDDTLKVIEIMNDLNLGWNEIPASARTGAFRANATASLHPALVASGVTLIDIQDKNGLTIFSANGATIRHAEFNVKRCNNVLIRNLKFDELWEWDEATKGDYDNKDWDFITIDMNCDGIWVDHCDFTKAYDGVVDIKGGSHNVTISWCRFLGDDGGSNSFVRQQINFLEQNPAGYVMYSFLRTRGFSVEDLVAIARSQKKGHLVGATEFNAANANLSVTLHHNFYFNFQDRIPRLRGGNAHDFNLYVNNTEALAAKRLRNTRVAAMSLSDALKLSNGTYKFDVTLNGAISTEDGAVLVEKCFIVDTLYPIRNNQTDPNDPNYTGKIRALDVIYNLDAASFRGDSEDPDSPLAPVPASPKAFSFNGFTTLPYLYTMTDPTQLPGLLTGAGRIGAGELNWAKTNWLRTSYPEVNQPPFPGAFATVTGQSVPVSVSVENLLAVAFDPDGDSVSVPTVSVLSTNNGTVTLAAGTIQYTPPAGYTGLDRFNYTLADTFGGLATGHVDVTVVPPDAVTLRLIGSVLTLGSFQALLGGYPGLTYVVDRASNIAGPWELGFTNLTAGPDGRISLTVPPNPDEPVRFYRTRYP